MTVVGIVSPGAMGSAVGRALRDGGARVVATVAGRSTRTVALAHGLELLPSLDDVVAAADVDPLYRASRRSRLRGALDRRCGGARGRCPARDRPERDLAGHRAGDRGRP